MHFYIMMASRVYHDTKTTLRENAYLIFTGNNLRTEEDIESQKKQLLAATSWYIDSVRRRGGRQFDREFYGKTFTQLDKLGESLHGLWEAAKTNIDFRSLGEVLQDLALDEARHADVVRPLLRRLDHQSQQQQWHKPVDDAGDELCWRRPLR